MKRAFLFVTLLLMYSVSTFAQTVTPVPSLMNFQGRIAKPDGTPVADGTYTVIFRIYDAQTGGNLRWSEQIGSIVTRNGVFATLLGNITPLSDTVFNGTVWLELQVNNQQPLLPRQRINTVAYAFKAGTVPDGTITSAKLANGAVTGAKIADGTITAASFAPNIFNPITWLLGGNSGTNANTQFVGTTDLQPLVFRTSNIERMRLTSDGALGIGTSNPHSNIWRVEANGAISSSSTSTAGFSIGNPALGNLYTDWAMARFANSTDLNFLRYQNGLFQGTAMLLQGTTGNVGIGTTTPPQQLSITGGIGFANQNAQDKQLWSPGDGLLRWQTNNNAGAHAFEVGHQSDTAAVHLDTLGNSWFTGGNVGFGEASPHYPVSFPMIHGDKISFWGDSGWHYGIGTQQFVMQFYTDGPTSDFVFGYGSSGDFHPTSQISGSGDISARNFFQTSDARRKHNIASIADPLATVLNLRGVTFDWNEEELTKTLNGDNRQIGFIAQEVEKVLPEIVHTSKDGYKSVAYANAVPVLVEAIKAQQKQIDALKKQNTEIIEQNKQIADLKAQLAALMAIVKARQETGKTAPK